MPAKILAVADIPRTMNGKIVELAVREAIHGRPIGNRDALANPQALDYFVDRPELESVTGPLALYRQRVERGELDGRSGASARGRGARAPVPRPAARDAAARLARPSREARRQAPRSLSAASISGAASGRGKTFMMDLFFNALPFQDKRATAFPSLHGDRARAAEARIATSRTRSSSSPTEIASETRIICFDEFAVTDIADAMLLGNLFAGLFARGVTLAATSNIVPDQLYADGLQRQRFLPTIALLKQHTEVVHVDGGTDYRLRALERADVYQTPTGELADQRLTEFFEAIAPDEGDHGGALELLGRPIPYRRAADGVIWFDFESICDGPRSQDDYIEISRLYQTVLVSNVPRFDATLENQARRFIALVDEFYDRRVKLILSAAAPATELYRGATAEARLPADAKPSAGDAEPRLPGGSTPHVTRAQPIFVRTSMSSGKNVVSSARCRNFTPVVPPVPRFAADDALHGLHVMEAPRLEVDLDVDEPLRDFVRGPILVGMLIDRLQHFDDAGVMLVASASSRARRAPSGTR